MTTPQSPRKVRRLVVLDTDAAKLTGLLVPALRDVLIELRSRNSANPNADRAAEITERLNDMREELMGLAIDEATTPAAEPNARVQLAARLALLQLRLMTVGIRDLRLSPAEFMRIYSTCLADGTSL